jgi:hypothetical protein
MASDSDDEGGFLDRDLEGKTNYSSTFYPVASARRCHVLQSLSSLASSHLHKMRIALKQDDEAVCCADSGATNHMFSDYSTFISYHKCSNKTVKLGNSTELPILGYGTAKFSLNGKIIMVRNALHVPGLTDFLYWKGVASSATMIVELSSSFPLLLLKWMIALTVY